MNQAESGWTRKRVPSWREIGCVVTNVTMMGEENGHSTQSGLRARTRHCHPKLQMRPLDLPTWTSWWLHLAA